MNIYIYIYIYISYGETPKNDVVQINQHTGFDEIQMSIGGRSNESSLWVRHQ